MSGREWHFLDYPAVCWNDSELHWSDDVLVKCIDGDITLAAYCVEKEEWVDISGERFTHSQVACWAYVGKVPETIKPMPPYRKEKA